MTEMGTRLQAIREACSVSGQNRTEDGINDILDFVKDVKFFARLSVLQQRSLCRTMTLEEFGPREFIFQMGETGDKFYIILSGSVGVQVPSQTAPCPNDVHSEKCDCPNRPLETVVFLEKGMGFGELALQSDQPRSATIMTSEKTDFLVTKRADYEMYAGQLHRQFIEQRVKFLRQCPRIEDALQQGLVSTQDIAAMANCLNEVQLSGNAVACRQGDVVDHMIFVRSGQLAVLRCVDLEKAREANSPKNKPRILTARATMGGAVAVKGPSQELIKTETRRNSELEYQPQWQLTQNLAKAMMDMKRKDRKARMDSIEQAENKKSEEDEAENAPPAPTSEPPSPTSGGEKVKKVQLPGAQGASSSEAGHESPDPGKGKAAWKRLQTSVTSASHLNRFVGGASGESQEEQSGLDAAKQNVDHFASVQAARRRYTQYTFKKKSESEKVARPVHRRSISSTHRNMTVHHRPSIAKIETTITKKHVRILRIGTLGPYEYFGDQQVSAGENYPVSLVSDPVAEIYMMSKHDILRRVPKKLFSALFNLEKDAVPSDVQLLEMHRQTERWNAFRRSMHGEALANLTRNQISLGHATSSGSRIDAVANMEFLGVNPHTSLGESLLPLPQSKGVALTPKDEELFSQASARFLRRFDIMKRDPGLRDALATAGLMRNARLHDGLPGSALDDDDQDPMAFRFDQHWYKLQKDPIGLDLDDVLSEDSSKQIAAAASATANATGSSGRPSVKAQRRSSTLIEPQNQRGSAVGGGGVLGSSATSMGSVVGMETLQGDDFSPRPPAHPRSVEYGIG